MPEGPSLVILREEAARFEGQEIMTAEGNTTAFEPAQVIGQPVLSLRTLGKQFIVELPDMAFRVHFMLSGSYRIDNARTARPAWRLACKMAARSISLAAQASRHRPRRRV